MGSGAADTAYLRTTLCAVRLQTAMLLSRDKVLQLGSEGEQLSYVPGLTCTGAQGASTGTKWESGRGCYSDSLESNCQCFCLTFPVMWVLGAFLAQN